MDGRLTLCGALERHLSKNAIRFHMPGHKGKNVIGLESIFDIDLTELYGLDNLHFPKGCIAYSETLAARFCGAKHSFFLVNGSSAGIIASVLASAGAGDRVVCARNSHASLFKGLCLSGAQPVYVMPEMLEYGICGGVDPSRVEYALKKAGDAKAVFVTSPTYEGFTSDIRKIAEITHRYDAALIVDEAHGAHFGFGGFPERAVAQGADMCVQSWHKTLTALGQGAVAHVSADGVNRINLERLRFYLSAMQTTSPSYAIMASLDATRALLEANGERLFAKYEGNLRRLREKLSRLKNIRLLPYEANDAGGVSDFDAGKITLYIRGGGRKLDSFLREKGILIEMASDDHAVIMTSFVDSADEYKKLFEAVLEFDALYKPGEAPGFRGRASYRIPEMVYTPAGSLGMRAVAVKAVAAAGRVSAGFITPYPPGIPLAVPGEVISGETAELCAVSGAYDIEMDGLSDGEYLHVLE